MISEIELNEDYEGKTITFNRVIEPSDWRYSAAIVGMIRFFDDKNIAYKIDKRRLYYNYADIFSENGSLEEDRKYLLFAEKWFSDKMHHKEVDIRLNKDGLEL